MRYCFPFLDQSDILSALTLFPVDWFKVQTAVQRVLGVMNRCFKVHSKLEASLRDLSRTGDIQSCKAARKAADGAFKELFKDLILESGSLQFSAQAAQIWPKVCLLRLKSLIWVFAKSMFESSIFPFFWVCSCVFKHA